MPASGCSVSTIPRDVAAMKYILFGHVWPRREQKKRSAIGKCEARL